MPDTYNRVSLSEFRLLLDTLQPRYLQTGIVTLLAASPGKIMSCREIVECLYGGCSTNQTPVIPETNIRVVICHLRKRGMPIRRHTRGYSWERTLA